MKRQGGPFPPRGGQKGNVSFSEKRRRLNVDGKGCKGVFLTTNTSEKHAIREFMNLIHQYLPDKDAHNAEAHAERSAADEVTDALKSELASLQRHQKRFVPMKDLLKGAIFIQFTHDDDIPSAILHGLMTRILEEPGVFSCRHISRILPVDATAEPTLEGLRRIVRMLVATSMPFSRAAQRVRDGESDARPADSAASGQDGAQAPETGAAAAAPSGAKETDGNTTEETEGDAAKPKETGEEAKGAAQDSEAPSIVSTWSCQYTSRSFDTVKKQTVLDLLADEVGPAYKVNIREAEFSIVVECNPVFFGVAMAHDFGKLFRYNLHRCCHPEEVQAEKSALAGAPSVAQAAAEAAETAPVEPQKADAAAAQAEESDASATSADASASVPSVEA
ncbi:hypothetical protein BESB_008060 [Besnoitia besnoiti]|uniref:THUMP domain-containing protein n=1 Tax=Besnoitia besnoiti TaxID=94643 RepID=A0A2A9MMB3_BESBE|nr:hypothetical protein BESB_008060 [Besnoitia besnoiti]PFH38464.1 hypothetical protein BESB_008060 [Besnoitia besnoiti]